MPTQLYPPATVDLSAVPLPMILKMDQLPACCPIDADRIDALSHEGARLGYDFVTILCGRSTIFIVAKFNAAIETRRLQRDFGLANLPKAPMRLGLTPRNCDTSHP